jgi:hypothetical protein
MRELDVGLSFLTNQRHVHTVGYQQSQNCIFPVPPCAAEIHEPVISCFLTQLPLNRSYIRSCLSQNRRIVESRVARDALMKFDSFGRDPLYLVIAAHVAAV